MARMLRSSTLILILLLSVAPTALAQRTITVDTVNDNSTAGDNKCSLREAIKNANDNVDNTSGDCTRGSSTGTDTIAFDISGTAPFTIEPLSKLPDISDPVIIDGTTQAGNTDVCSADIPDRPAYGLILDGSSGVSRGLGFIEGSDGSTVKGLNVRNFPSTGILLLESDNHTITCNFVGTNEDGTEAMPNGDYGMRTNLNASNNTFSDNLVSGNINGGILIEGTYADSNLVVRNFIGTDASGTAALPNEGSGIVVEAAPGTTIGEVSTQNLISGNEEHGIESIRAEELTILSNYIGTDITGTFAIPNGASGISMWASDSEIGGTASNRRNLISGNTEDGIFIDRRGTTIDIENNYIGTDVSGTYAIGNGIGITVQGYSNNIGTVNAGNVISGNVGDGLAFAEYVNDEGSSVDNIAYSNLIGTTADGTTALANGGHGIRIEKDAVVTIGHESNANGANTISGNSKNGIYIDDATADWSIIRSNYIGTTETGLNLGNGKNGILVNEDVEKVHIGWPGSPNTIAYNAEDGVAIENDNDNILIRVRENIFFDNGELSIDLRNDGVTLNDVGDGDGGPNERQNYPTFTALIGCSGDLTIEATLDSPNAATESHTLYFFKADAETQQEGAVYFGSVTYQDYPNTISINLGNAASLGIVGGEYMVASANDNLGNASELSPAVLVSGCVSVTTTADAGTGSLREAIENANAMESTDIITFDFAASGPHVITLLSALPEITDRLVFDGALVDGNEDACTTALADRPAYQLTLDGNGGVYDGITLGAGSDGSTIQGLNLRNFGGAALVIDGSNDHIVQCNFIGTDEAGTSTTGTGNTQGIVLTNASGILIGGTEDANSNLISGNTGQGVQLGSGATSITIQGNYVGTDKTGAVDLGNGTGILIDGGYSNTIGGTETGTSNLISGNTEGIEIKNSGATGNGVYGNLIGTDVSGTTALGNSNHGIFLQSGANDNIVGGTDSDEANTIAYNGGNGIAVVAGTGNVLEGNSFFENGGLGIDLGNNGSTANDAGDADTGGNNLQNTPVFSHALLIEDTKVAVNYSVDSDVTAQAYPIEVAFYTVDVDEEEGQTYIGSVTYSSDDATNDADALLRSSLSLALGSVLVAIATDANGNTSEFSAPVTIGSCLEVTTTADTGAGSLRQAMTCGNFVNSNVDITFNIAGTGPHIITPVTALPALKNNMNIDGASQPGNEDVCSKPIHNRPAYQIVIDGNGAAFDGFRLAGGYMSATKIKGLNIRNFNGSAISNTAYAYNFDIFCNFIGTNETGDTAMGNTAGITFRKYSSNSGSDIGLAPSQGNLISGNTTNIALIGGASGYRIYSNFIGTDQTGTTALGGDVGILLNGTDEIEIGSTSANRENLVSGNTTNILLRSGAKGTEIHGNLVGTDRNGTAAIDTTSIGIELDNAKNNDIGGGSNNSGNLISGNAVGVWIHSGSSGNTVRDNFIGLDLSGTGALPNTGHGVALEDASDNQVGGAAYPNTIAYNGGAGIAILGTSTQERVLGNATYENGGLGIDLGGDGATANDTDDADSGANNVQNYPTLNASLVDTDLTVIFSVDTDPSNATYPLTIRFYRADGDEQEGQEFLTSESYTADDYADCGVTPCAKTVTLDADALGLTDDSMILATAMDDDNNTSEFSPAVSTASCLVVSTTADSGEGSLREAIDCANFLGGLDAITFDIEGDGPHVITPTSALPVITDPLFLNGASQPGNESVCTAAIPSRPAYQIILDGNGLNTDGLVLDAGSDGSTIQGLNIRNFGTASSSKNAIEINSNNNAILCNFLGTNEDGTATQTTGTNGVGVAVANASGTTIGGTNAADGNLSSGFLMGIRLVGYDGFATNATVQGNYLGTDASGTDSLGNANSGIYISEASNNLIGGTTSGAANLISGNRAGITVTDGVAVTGSAVGNTIQQNIIFGNTDEGIDVGTTRDNDAGDSDDGPNKLQNFPELLTTILQGDDLILTYQVDSDTANHAYPLAADFFFADADSEEGETYVVTDTLAEAMYGTVRAFAIGNAAALGITATSVLVATATDADGNTSEFSDPVTVVSGNCLEVTTTANSGLGSLAQAMYCANAIAGEETITFNIAGDGPHVIAPDIELPYLSDTVVLDGASQPSNASVCTTAPANRPTYQIVLDGTNAGGAASGFVLAAGSDGSTIQGFNIRNFGDYALLVDGSSTNTIVCNALGTDETGTLDQGNDLAAIRIQNSATDNTIGGTGTGDGNIIAFNGTDGINTLGNGTIRNTILGNAFFENGFLGIDIGEDNTTSNDANDGDSGSNLLQNFPEITTAQLATETEVRITYEVDAAPSNQAYPLSIEFFRADVDGLEGQTLLGRTTYAEADAQASIEVILTSADALSAGELIVATATDADGNTSEFSAAAALEYADCGLVTNTADTGIGTLREAITCTNANAGLDTISFDITGDGPHVITPLTELPDITDAVLLDGTTQTSNETVCTAAIANRPTYQIILDGDGGNFDGLRLAAGSDGSTIQGLNIRNFGSDGLDIDGSANHFVLCNFIGTDEDGNAAMGNGDHGVRVHSAATGTTFGGTTEGAGNLISGNNSRGLSLTGGGVENHVVQGNYIGTDKTSTAALGNGTAGVHVSGGKDNMIGGSAAGAGNTIAYNTQDGIVITGNAARRNAITGNTIFENGELGIDVGNDDVTANDTDDADTGPNNLQNTPDLIGAVIVDTDLELSYTIDATPENAAFPLTVDVYTADGDGEEGEALFTTYTFAESDTSTTVTAIMALPDSISTGTIFVATATDADGNTSEFSAPTTASDCRIITTTADDGPGSLRNAITCGNTLAGADTLTFNIAGEGPHIITPLTALPNITTEMVIDGSSQPGNEAVCTTAIADRPTYQIILDGNGSNFDGLKLRADSDGSTIQGLNIRGFGQNGIDMNLSNDNKVLCSFIGTDEEGTAAVGNADAGIYIGGGQANQYGGKDNTVGGTAVGHGNLISGNGSAGVFVDAATLYGKRNAVLGNYIGTDKTGTTSLGNGEHGVRFDVSSGSVGGLNPGEGNIIAFNTMDGVAVSNSLATVTIEGNAIFENGDLGIDLSDDGVTSNDGGNGDSDDGPNEKHNFPSQLEVSLLGKDLQASYTISSSTVWSNYPINVAFYVADADSSEGQTYLGSVTYGQGKAQSDVTDIFTPAVAVPEGAVLVATATDDAGNTSEFSAPVTVAADCLVVTNTDDDGVGSLRTALTCANTNTDVTDTITFNIAGTGPHVITPASQLPGIIDPVVLNGSSQPGNAAVCTAAIAERPAYQIVLDGDNGNFDGLRFLSGSDSSTVKGLNIRNFRQYGMEIDESSGHTIHCNFIGTDETGTTAESNSSGLVLSDAANNQIGGSGAGEGNLISGHDASSLSTGIYIGSSNSTENRIEGNYIGTDKTGTTPLGNGRGIWLVDAIDTAIGSTTAAAGNLISGNLDSGITLGDASGTVVKGNHIGTDADGTTGLGNANWGIALSGSDHTIGGTETGAGNTIAFNSTGGVGLFTGSETGNAILGNSIFDNGGLGIDLGRDDTTANDTDDADTGINNLQNTPTLIAAELDGTDLHVSFSIDTDPGNATYPLTVEYFVADSDSTEGQTYLGSASYEEANAQAFVQATITLPVSLSGDEVIVATATDANGNTSEFSVAQAITNVTPSQVTLSVSAWLEGPYDTTTGTMTVGLSGYLPQDDPYSIGASVTSADFFTTDTNGQNVVDWIWIELRTGDPDASPMTTVARTAALLLSDGRVKATDATSDLTFDVDPGSYYLAVGHRNHLAVLSAAEVDCSTGTCTYDFRSTSGQSYGTDPLAEIETGVWALCAGDGSEDGQITATDLQSFWRTQNGGTEGYHSADFNLNGEVTAADLQGYWRINNSRESRLPDSN